MTLQPPDEAGPQLDRASLAGLLVVQDGVVSRRQLRGLQARDHDIARMLRRRELTRVRDGIYVDHTGPLTWEQRAWVALLCAWPAALSHESALPAPPQWPIHVAIGLGRSPAPLPGVRFHRMVDLDSRVQWTRSPPRVRVAQAAIDVAMGKGRVDERFQVLAQVCQTRQTDVRRIRGALATRQRVPGRKQLLQLLEDLENGACSVLERGYLELERRHGFPTAQRQHRTTTGGRPSYVDVRYPTYGIRLELDGRAFHDSARARDADAERDLDGRIESDEVTVRLTYGQVFGRGCATARKLALLLERRGWPGPFVPCPGCAPPAHRA